MIFPFIPLFIALVVWEIKPGREPEMIWRFGINYT